MTDTSLKYTDKDLIGVLAFLLRHIKEVKAQSEALRFLCEKHGVFDHAEYLRVYAEAIQTWDQSVSDTIRAAAEAANLAMLQKLIEMPTGKPQ
jgi:hypothetical protein